jgi:uncharacterized protein YfdQ (DUF2303 family)
VIAGAAAVGIEDRLKIVDVGNGARVAVAVGNGGRPFVLESVTTRLRDAAPAPPRRTGNATLHEVESFIAYVNRYKIQGQTTLWADAKAFTMAAVLDDAPEGADITKAGWCEHRARYICPRSPEWIAWTGLEGKALRQEAFAQLLEDRLEELTSGDGFPAPAEMLSMARSLTINVQGKFRRQIDPTTGTGILQHENEHGAGSTKIPRAFLLALRVFDGGATYRVEARIRFSLTAEGPTFSFNLHRREVIERDAFGEVRERVGSATGLVVFAGASGA